MSVQSDDGHVSSTCERPGQLLIFVALQNHCILVKILMKWEITGEGRTEPIIYVQKVLGLLLWEWPRAEIVPLFLSIISLYLDAFSPTFFQFDYLFKVKCFFLVPKVLINGIYNDFIASKIPTTKVSFNIRKQIWPKGLNLENKGD